MGGVRGKPFRFSLATDLLANVSPGTPPSNVLLAAWAALVMRQLDVEQVIVMARDGPGDRTVVRMALRIDANDSLGDLAGRVSAAAQTDERADDRRVIRLGLADRGFTTDGYSPGDDQVPVLTWWLNGQRVEA